MKKITTLLITLLMCTSFLFAEVTKTIQCDVAGTLRTLLTTEEMTSVTNLIVTGQIDTRDFSVFRDMSGVNALRVLDLSNANVIAYTTAGGYTYKANTIHKQAFYNAFLTQIALPQSVTTIEELAFSSNSGLQNVELPTALKSIGKNAFLGCTNLATPILPNGLETIEPLAFSGCTTFTNITIPQSVIQVGKGAFYNCSNLTAILVDANSTHFASINGALYSKDGKTLYSYPAGLTTVALANTIEVIVDSAFLDCIKLTSVSTFPETLQKIGKEAFKGCSNLTGHLELPNSITEIGASAFLGASGISGTITIPSSVNRLGDYAFSGCSNLSGLSIEASLDTIPTGLCYNCTKLNGTLSFPESVKVINNSAFYNCQEIDSIHFPSSLNQIGEWAFYNNRSVKTLSLPHNISVNQSAFNNCVSLQTLTLEGYASLYNYAFASCTALSTINSHSATPPYFTSNTFSGVNTSTCIVNIPAGKTATYRNYNTWNTFTNIVEFDNGVNPTLVNSYPTQNQLDISIHNDLKLYFNESITVKKAATLIDNATSQVVATLSSTNFVTQEANLIYELEGVLTNSKSYSIVFPQGFVEDNKNNPWPQTNPDTLLFTTSPARSTVSIDFLNDAKENMSWTTTASVQDNETYMLNGYWDFEIKNIPMRWYTHEWVSSETALPTKDHVGAVNLADQLGLLEVHTSGLNNTITNVKSQVYENNCYLRTTLFHGLNIIDQDTLTNTITNPAIKSRNGYSYLNQQLTNPQNEKVDLITFKSLEGHVLKLDLEIIDLTTPTVELGSNQTICANDSVILDAGFTPGAIYTWNTGANSQKITVKTSGLYAVTVKNTLGQATDSVTITVNPQIQLNLPDTITACVGETVTLTAGTNTSYNYLWSPTGENTPSIDVTESGVYHVIVSNGSCLATDSVCVIFKGAKLDVFFNQGGMCGANDVQGELYRREQVGMLSVFTLYESKNMPQLVRFDSLPAGEYLFKAHFVSYSFVGENPFIDTYNGGTATWSAATPFSLTCTTDTTISFSLANKPTGFSFVGTGTIAGQVVFPIVDRVRGFGIQSDIPNPFSNVLVMLYDGTGTLIATASPDANSGHYSFTNLPAGTYSISVEYTGYSLQSVFSTNLSEGASVSNANFTIDEETHTIVQGIQTGLNQPFGDESRVTLVPNRVLTSAQLAIASTCAGRATVTLYDMTGRVCNQFQMNLVAGNNETTITNNGIKGLYLLKVATSEKTTTLRVIFE